MKRVVLLFVIGVITLSLTSPAAEAQRSGSMQATARVVDTRVGLNGLQLARELASRWVTGYQTSATVSGTLTRVSVRFADRPPAPLEFRRTAVITVNYLRN